MEGGDDGWVDPLVSLFSTHANTAAATTTTTTTATWPYPAPPPGSSSRHRSSPLPSVDVLLFGEEPPALTPPRNPFLDLPNLDAADSKTSLNPFLKSDEGSSPDVSVRSSSTRQQQKPALSQRQFHHSSSLSEGASVFGTQREPLHRRETAPVGRYHSLSFVEDVAGEGGDLSIEEPLREFVGCRGEEIFQAPPRAALHPGRPPPLEVRPHPLRETQSGSFLRTIACTPTQLWAGHESGLRYWDLDQLFSERDTRVPKGDEESAPFRESVRTSPTLCLAVDLANRLIWSGHRDGKIRYWSMDQPVDSCHSTSSAESGGDSATTSFCVLPTIRFREDFSWQAHRGSVLSMVFTSYGDLWTGSEGGIIKIWPWEALMKSLSKSVEERNIASLGLERSYVDLRSQVTVAGVCPLPSSDIKFLLSDSSRSRVWSGSSLSFALWNSHNKELLKVFDIDGQVEGRIDIPSSHFSHVEDEMKIKFVSTSKKEKSHGSMSFFQRSRNAIMGAADAVLRVATKGTFGEDYRRTEAINLTIDGMIWTGCANGSLIQWNGNGNRVQEFQYHSSSIQCMCSFGSRLWVGYASGMIQILDLEGIVLGEWTAHSSPIIKMATSSNYIFSLANHGGVRGWNLASPGRLDEILRLELTKKEQLFTKVENIKILVGTWNVGQERASYDSLVSWVGSVASKVDVVVVGLQEVEMGAGFLAMAAAKETVGLEGSANGQWWLDTIGKTLDEGATFERIGSRQLAGLLISAWARKRLRRYIGDIDVGAVPCGFGRALGNKGSVGLRMRVYDRVLCFMNCHFAAHMEAVSRRNADFEYVYRSMSFSKPSSGYHSAGAGPSPGFQLLQVSNSTGSMVEEGKPELSEADMVVFLGDLNYRLHGVSYDEARESISQRSFDWLRETDQLRSEMKAGRVFQGLREGIIRFPPTYKFEKHKMGLSGYDSGEKKRVPAWCDRILYRDSRSVAEEECGSDCLVDPNKGCSLRCPIVSSILQYDACMDVTDSDHKPVRCLFNINIACSDELVRRKEIGKILSSNKEISSINKQFSVIPDVIVSSNSIVVQSQGSSTIRITNKCEKANAMFEVSCDGEASTKLEGSASEPHPRCAFGFPRWLEVNPAAGIIYPCRMIEIRLRLVDYHAFEEYVDGVPQNWCEFGRNKETILAVNIRGSFSHDTKRHMVHIRRCPSLETQTANPGNVSGRIQSSS